VLVTAFVSFLSSVRNYSVLSLVDSRAVLHTVWVRELSVIRYNFIVWYTRGGQTMAREPHLARATAGPSMHFNWPAMASWTCTATSLWMAFYVVYQYLLTFVLCWIGFCYMKYSSVSLALVVLYLNIGTIWYMSFDSMEQLWLKIVEELDFWLSKHIQKLLAISTRSLPTPVIYSDHRWMWRGNTCLCLCVCLSVCAVRALTFECLDLQTAFMVYSYSFGIFRSRFSIKSWHWDKVRVVWA